MFVKEHYDKVKHLPNKERLGALSKMFKGDDKPKGGEAKPKDKPKRGRKMKE